MHSSFLQICINHHFQTYGVIISHLISISWGNNFCKIPLIYTIFCDWMIKLVQLSNVLKHRILGSSRFIKLDAFIEKFEIVKIIWNKHFMLRVFNQTIQLLWASRRSGWGFLYFKAVQDTLLYTRMYTANIIGFLRFKLVTFPTFTTSLFMWIKKEIYGNQWVFVFKQEKQ